MCPDWTDPRNVGAAFRLADAAGVQRLVLTGSTPRPPHPKIRKTARTTERSVEYESADDAVQYVRDARERGAHILALEITDRSESLFTYAPPVTGEIVLIAGNEAAGIPRRLLAECDASVHLPMYGRNTSMNVSVALGAAVYLLLMKLQ
ncbi:TrmH family RNA methyltransferase [Neolewinella marina]|uniref:TrmH family RNA methyltransferase n=1 Tax=Neolewinella marina TaxID=438751 RepID=UPI0021CDDCD2|nr:TrmH family RNA methyltransferase [Neolewinella marina]